MKLAATLSSQLTLQRGVQLALGITLLVALTSLGWMEKPQTGEAWESLREGNKLGFSNSVTLGLWWGVVGSALLSALLLGLSMKPSFFASLPEDTPSPAPVKAPPWFWAILTGMIFFGAWSTYPRLEHSLWGDEEYSMKRFIVGEIVSDEEGEYTIESIEWKRTLWDYRNPNNHTLYSLLARIVHGPAHQSTAADVLYFSEVQLRLPAFFFALASLVALAWALKRHFSPGVSLLATATLCLHPWWLRYAAEARAYSLVLFIIPCLIALTLHLAQRPTWRRCWLFAIGQAVAIWAYPATLYWLLWINGALIFFLLPRHGNLRLGVKRLVFTGGMVGIAMIPLVAPLVPQLLHYLSRPRARASLSWAQAEELASYFSFGRPWESWDANNPLIYALNGESWGGLALGGASLLLLGGVHVMIRSGWCSRSLAAIALGPLATFLIVAFWQEQRLYHWYLVPFFPGALFPLAAWLEALTSRWVTKRWAYGLATALIALYAVIVWPKREALRREPIEALRDSVAIARPVINPFAPDYDAVLTAEFLMHPRAYDPGAHRLLDPSLSSNEAMDREGARRLRKGLAHAQGEQKDLWVNFAQLGKARQEFPRIMAILEDGKLFAREKVFYGHEPFTTRYVYAHRIEQGGKP